MKLPYEVSKEIQDMLNELESEYPPLLDTDLTREIIAAKFNISLNGAKGRAAKMVQSGKWVEVIKRHPNGSRVVTYKSNV